MPNPAPNGVAAMDSFRPLSLMVKGTVIKKCSPKKTRHFTHMFTIRGVANKSFFVESDLHVTFINEGPAA